MNEIISLQKYLSKRSAQSRSQVFVEYATKTRHCLPPTKHFSQILQSTSSISDTMPKPFYETPDLNSPLKPCNQQKRPLPLLIPLHLSPSQHRLLIQSSQSSRHLPSIQLWKPTPRDWRNLAVITSVRLFPTQPTCVSTPFSPSPYRW
jgi:hypothetical protein